MARGLHRSDRMTPKPSRPAKSSEKPTDKPSGKPTIGPETHDANVGQREQSGSKEADRGKASIEPGKQDAKIGEDGVLTDDSEAG
jgi:hypothetical protein